MKHRFIIKLALASLAAAVSALNAASANAVPKTITVGPSDNDYTTIQAAINAADAGDTIQVAAGTYNEFVDVSKPLSIRGANYGVDPNTDSRGDESIIS
jgi:pectin methylesterase-like acyl-CoA thioesterase